MSKQAVIGCNGYLGRHISLFLHKLKTKNSFFDFQEAPVLDLLDYKSLNIRNRDEFELLHTDLDVIYFMAGKTGTAISFSEHRDFMETNETGLLNLLSWMKDSGCRARIVFPSTRLVYQGQLNKLLNENDPKEVKTVYALNKLSGEYLLGMYQRIFGIPYTVFRICVPYGNLTDQKVSYGTIGFLMDQALNKKQITLYGDGNTRRTFTHVADIGRIIIEAAKKKETCNDVFNIGGENFSLKEIAGMMSKKFDVPVHFEGWPDIDLKLESGDTMFDDTRLSIAGLAQYHYSFESWLSTL